MAIDDSGERAVAREIEVALSDAERLLEESQTSFDNELCILETAELIAKHGYRRVALQIPDDLFPIAFRLAQSLRSHIQNESVDIFVLGDTSYGNCCVDEVAAEHHTADFVVHYGHSCLSRASRLPVQLVFTNRPLNVELAAETIAASVLDGHEGETKPHIVLVRDVRYDYAMPDLVKELAEKHEITASLPEIKGGFRPLESFEAAMEIVQEQQEEKKAAPIAVALGQEIYETQDFVAIYIGSENEHLAQTALTLGVENCKRLLAYDPAENTCDPPTRQVTSLISKRFLKVQQTRDASMIGLLVGTMGVQGYSEVLNNLSKLAHRAGKKTYTFLMGKINPQKLANFAHIDAYVLVACPLNSLLDSREFFKPVVTPFELEVALDAREWSTRFALSFTELASLSQLSLDDENDKHKDGDNDDDDDDTPHFSLATGKLIHAAIQKPSPKTTDVTPGTAGDDALVKHGADRHIAIRYSSPAADALAELSFRGMESNKGDKAPQAAVKGQSGTASGLYTIGDPQTKR